METLWEDNFVEVVEKDGFKSLFAKKNYDIGDVICSVEGEEIDVPNRYSVHVGNNVHVNVKEPVMYINHDCLGNIILVNRTFVANRRIKKGDEIAFDYNTTENELAEPFTCFRCNQLVKGENYKSEYPCFNSN